MAFNFNWSPLTADAGFYTRAQELLTTALNKSPKPPIIVDDILVNELNLGHVPPELEILEIGDLAEDRFRGIFKMSYNGDAFLTLKTRVQANPLNTHLLTRPVFASPQPLAAATGLTIPLQITLSDIRLSAFIILVFSRQKGITLVFRNDPLESLKVSSTFDSIPFVANYLQKEIEGQLRLLLMDELPAIIHRLSLRLWVPEYKESEGRESEELELKREEPAIDPLASPPQDPVDATGQALNPSQIASLSLDSGVETQSLFSQKNLLRLATLNDSHRTLSLFTPSIRDAVFRAWTGPLERGELSGFHTRVTTPALSRTQSFTGSLSNALTMDKPGQVRPSLQSFASTSSVSMNSSRYAKSHSTRKRKKRVVNLRKQNSENPPETILEDDAILLDSASVTESTSSAPSVFSAPPATTSSGAAIGSVGMLSPPASPTSTRQGKQVDRTPDMQPMVASVEDKLEGSCKETDTVTQNRDLKNMSVAEDLHRLRTKRSLKLTRDLDATPRASMYLTKDGDSASKHLDPDATLRGKPGSSTSSRAQSPSQRGPLPNFLHFITDPANGGSISERAWMMRMASEISRRYEEERSKGRLGGTRPQDDDLPPPAYTS